MEEISWGSVVVAVAILLVIGGVGITAILRYPVDHALKVWGALGGLLGVVTGVFVTYFFTRQPLAAAQQRAEAAEIKVVEAEARAKELEKQATAVASRVYFAAKTPGLYASAYLKDPVIGKFVGAFAPGVHSSWRQLDITPRLEDKILVPKDEKDFNSEIVPTIPVPLPSIPEKTK